MSGAKKPKKAEPNKSGFGSLRAAAKRVAADEIDLAESEEESGTDAAPEQPTPPNATMEIVRSAFESAVTSRMKRRLMHGKAMAVVVLVPSSAWIEPVMSYARRNYGTHWRMQLGSTGKDLLARSKDAALDLSFGACVMGIAADAKTLPATLTTAADIVIRLDPPSAATLRRAIARFTGRNPGELPADTGAGRDLYELAAAFRPGTGAKAIARRLGPGSKSPSVEAGRVPALETAVEYGEARIWGLSLARDIAEFRAGRIQWKDADHGVCLCGAPGTGKSLYARILAKACGIPLVATSVAQWFAESPGYLDSVIKAQRAAFASATAQANPCCLLMIDELEALPSRVGLSSSQSKGRDFWLPLITDTLLNLDSSLANRSGIIVMGCTNFVSQVDPALLRPGRLEKVIEIKPPDASGATNILRFHTADDLAGQDLSHLGPLLEGCTGAEIMYVVRAARRAARQAGRPLEVNDIEAAALPPLEAPPAMLFRMAIHESAHAVAALATGSGRVDKVVLRFDGTSGGRTVVADHDRDLVTRTDIENRVIVGLAARAAEALLCGSVSTGGGGGAGSDLAVATAMIASVHASFGLGEDLAFLGSTDEAGREMTLNRELRQRVERDLRELNGRAEKVVATNSAAIVAVAQVLAKKRHMTGAEVEAIVGDRLVREPRGAAAA